MLKRGSSGPEVSALQSQLGIPADGVFGPGTEAAVRAFQAQHGLTPDGIAGPSTLAALAPAKSLTAEDFEGAASALASSVAAVKAVTEVESRGNGFLPDGRPVILFERHIMHRRLSAIGRDAVLLSGYLPDVINATPGGYSGGIKEHGKLHLARQIDPACAIESASWGLFQIMGFHWQTLGYESAADFERLMCESEGRQLEAFVRFVIVNPAIHTALRKGDWAAFAKGYNGPAYVKNQYDIRLAAAFKKHGG